MTCFVPFNSKNLDITFFVFRPVVVLMDDLNDALKHFSLCSEGLGCVYNSILQSIHGNMTSMLSNVSSMAILLDHSFFDAYAGESRDSSLAAKFSTGDTLSMTVMVPAIDDVTELSYACLALFKSCFLKMEGVTAGICFKCHSRPRVACLYVWRSLHSCYSWLLNTDYRKIIQPYLDLQSHDLKYDIFRVVYVSGDNILNLQFYPAPRMFENKGESSEDGLEMQECENSAVEL
ncbi:hypothetical protein HHK36_023316 [Tetracentron sinense]|uniref:DUF7392 domain-containing protein n=1 Tax=Tetracentron sinense TaxID=13715 RepID=A0A834YQ62_TETSI|nr:hypothetical protein HHK36_023316 [Tetracentron sinense]